MGFPCRRSDSAELGEVGYSAHARGLGGKSQPGAGLQARVECPTQWYE